MFEFCDPELFTETLQNSEVTSSSNCGYDLESSSYTASLSQPPDLERFNGYQENNNGYTNTTTTSTTTTTTTTTSTATVNTINSNNNNNTNLSIIFDSQDDIDNDISASIDFSPSPTFTVPQFLTNQQEQLDLTSLQHQIQLSDVVDGISQYPADPVSGLMGPPLPAVFEEDCLSSVPSYVPLNTPSPSCSFLGPAMGAYMASASMTAALSAENPGFFAGSSFVGCPELQPQDLEFQGDNGGIFCPDSIQCVFAPGDLQALSGESTQLVGGVGSSTPLATEISSLEDSAFKVGKLSVEQRKEKIHRYMKKRNERNFSKKIKYACRKTLADSRPRVRGRFAKNDEFGEPHRNPEEEDDDEVGVKEEDEMVDSSDIFAHISGVNSFKCNYPLQSWIG
ncbi:CCT motif family protein isoform 1 [Tripterygium wilfordii]|uniref:CCT motif family protein isoform 1 n=1 Tax=Tripterygium wilfordii TaxID=458696 RepID=A0A7J7E1D3_TRIWF|nr:zinc finger protein HD1-like [Tripterygium wilfordii]KAF5752418.1 CCT motif family protein isoform 1 [Tripterygium wilfordii]